jgi:hypothetical protein
MELEPGSFRDRTGRIFYAGDEVYRALTPRALADWEAVQGKKFLRQALSEGKIVATERAETGPGFPLPPGGPWAAVLRHERIPFVSYPYEWCFGMLRDAALLHLELLEAALAEDVTLKDASSYNVQWIGPRPVFIDVLSLAPLRPGEPWIGYRQFCELFLYPLLLEAYKGVPFQPWLRGRIDGIAPRDVRGLFSLRDLLRPGVLSHVVLHARSEALDGGTTNVRSELAAAGFHKELILANVRRLARLVRGLAPARRETVWSRYGAEHGYEREDREEKERFVREAATTRRFRLVWDLGANTGDFSRIAAAHAETVIALEGDRLAVETLYEAVRKEGVKNVLPLVANLADPSPDQGWRGVERRSLPERGRPELVLCLALIHHMVLGANVRLGDFVDWLARLGSFLVIEFVTREDPMVQRLLRHKDAEIYDDYDLAPFEAALQSSFEVLARREIAGGRRILYFARSRIS